MRWQALFDDLEAQLDAAESAALDAEVRDRTRREAALVRGSDRLRAARGTALTLAVQGVPDVAGRLLDAGDDWLLLEEAGLREVLVPTGAVLAVSGLGRGATGPQGEVERRLDLRWALRGLTRSRAPVRLALRDGRELSGTLERVGTDHVDLAEHAVGELRRASAVRGARMVPLPALALVRQD